MEGAARGAAADQQSRVAAEVGRVPGRRPPGRDGGDQLVILCILLHSCDVPMWDCECAEDFLPKLRDFCA